jgi:hypothetical protein
MVHLKVLLKNMFLKTKKNDFYGQTRNAPRQYITPQNSVAHKMPFVTIEHHALIQFFPEYGLKHI